VSVTPIQAPSEQQEAAPARGMLLPFDPLLLLAVLGLGTMSVFTLRQATRFDVLGSPHYYVERQIIYLSVGIVLMLAVSRLDYSRLRELKYVLYGVLLVSILAVLGLGHSANGAQRAITLPFFSFQGSEIGKILLILCLAAFAVDRARALRQRDTTARVMLLALVPAMVVIAQPDLGSGMVYVVVAVAVLFAVGTPWQHLLALFVLGVLAITIVLVVAPAVGVHVLKPYQVQRLTAFLHPSQNAQAAYQQVQSKIAIGAGGKTGRGPNASQTGLNFVPEHGTDFIFAAVGEQYGFVGAAVVLSLYALLIWRSLRILTMSKNLFGALVAAGVVAMLLFQIFVNVGMSIGIMPITGVTLPLLSYGGSSVLTVCLAIGLLQSIYVQGRAAAALKGRVLRF
jgi:rod shape determining protein RodA